MGWEWYRRLDIGERKNRAGRFPTLGACLRHPARELRRFDAAGPDLTTIPYRTWSLLTGIAVAGSALYGTSLSLVFPRKRPLQSALWLTLSAGLSWLLFGPALIAVTRRSPLTLAQACLVTMGYGEGMLVTGAGINMAAAWISRRSGRTWGDQMQPAARPVCLAPARFNLAWVALSNVVMATMLTVQLRALGIPAWKTALSWMGLLNGSGVLFFRLLQPFLWGER